MDVQEKNILMQVAKLYSKYGIKSITMDDVARELGISKKTLYQYFQDKTELIFKVIQTISEEKMTCFDKIQNRNLNSIEELFEVNSILIQFLKEYNPAFEFDLKKYYPELYNKFTEIRRQKMYNSVLENLKKGKKEGLYRSELDEEIIARLHVSRIDAMMDNKMFTVEEFTSEKIITEVFNYHIRGIASELGIKELKNQIKKHKS